MIFNYLVQPDETQAAESTKFLQSEYVRVTSENFRMTVKVILSGTDGAACPMDASKFLYQGYRTPRSSVQNRLLGIPIQAKHRPSDVRQLQLLNVRLLSKVRVVSPISRISSFLTMLLSDVSSVPLRANTVNSILHPHGLSRNMLTSCLHSSSSCSTLLWPVVYFQHLRSVPLSLQLSRRWHWIRSIWATTGRFPIWHLFLSCSNMQLMSKLLDTRRENQLLPDTQSAYQKHRSTETAILKVLSDVYEAADSGKLTLLGLLDLSAAFDTVDHQILLGRLRHSFGISGTVLDWIASYLTGRTQFVRFNGQSSKTVPDDFRRSSRFGSWADPSSITYTAKSQVLRGSKAWFQRSCIPCSDVTLQIYDHTAPVSRHWPACCNEWPSVLRMFPPGCPRIDLCLQSLEASELIWLGSSRQSFRHCATWHSKIQRFGTLSVQSGRLG